MASCWLATHRGRCRICIRYHLSDGSYVEEFSSYVTTAYSMSGGLATGAYRASVKMQAPSNAVTMQLIIWLYGIDDNNDKICYAGRPMLEECTEYTTQPSAWQNAGVTSIHGGSIVANTITAQQILAGTITANEIATGAIAAKHIASNTISASHIVSKSLTSDKLNVSTLSAISANMGNITAGSLNIASKFIVSSSGAVEIRGASGNVGMIIRNDRIDVYDASGNLKVRLGKLT